MPVCRYHIRSAQCLADPELLRAAGKDDSEALLEAVAVAGLVGFLRQLGDLAQFAAELFHDLHEEVMTTAARGHSLISRVQQLETEVPALEKAFMSQTHNFSFFTNGGIDWHPNLQSEHNLVTRGGIPRFIMDSYEECRGPPRLFLLDKYDVAGAGGCLKRYTNPSFFTEDPASSVTATAEEVVHREKRIRKVKKREVGSRNGETPEAVPSHTKLHQLFLEERIEDACSDPGRLVKLRKKELDGYAIEEKTGRSYMEKILKMSSPDHKMVYETSVIPQPVKLMSDDSSETRIKILEISSNAPRERSFGIDKTHSSPNEQDLEWNPYSEMDRETNRYLVKMHDQISAGVAHEMSSNNLKSHDETELVADEQEKRECILDSLHSDDAISEVDDYVDALATAESEFDSDNECRLQNSLLNAQNVTESNKYQLDTQFSDAQSFGESFTSEEISSIEQDRNEEHNEVQVQLPDFQSVRSLSSEIKNMPFNQLLQSVELQKTCGDFVMQNDTHDQRSNFEAVPEVEQKLKFCTVISDTHGNPHNEPDSAEVEVLYRDQRSNFEAVPRRILGDEIIGSTCSSSDLVEDDGHITRQDNHVVGNDKFIVKVQSENHAISSLSPVDIAENDASIVDFLASDSISIPSRDLSNLHEPFLCSSDSHYIEMESNEVGLTKIHVDLNADKMENQLEPSSGMVFSPIFSLTKLEGSLSNFSNPNEKEMEVNEAVAEESLTELAAHEVLDQPEIASADVELNLKRPIPGDPSVSGIFNSIQHSSLKKNIEYGSSINDMKMVAFQAQQMQLSNQLEQERVADAASKLAAEVYPDESSHDSSSKSSGESNPTNHVMDPLKPLLSDLIPKEPKTNFEEIAPMPPLPPMQWRMNKVQNVSLVSQSEEKEASQVSPLPIQPVNHDDKAQFGFSTTERETLLCHNPFFPVTAVESSNHQHSAGLSASVSERAAAIPLQYPVMVNEGNGQPNYLALEGCQAQNPLLTTSVVASEGEKLLNSSPCPPTLPEECAVSGADPIFLQEKPTQSRSQLMKETSLEVKTLEQSSINLEGEQADPSVSPVSPSTVVRSYHSMLPSDGELTLSEEISAPISKFHSEIPNGKPKKKFPPPPPQAPSNDVLAALDKSRLRKVTERVRPQVAPKEDEIDSLLEQIRTKSFNLKPAAAKRPSILGPKTNLRVTAILEKANSIRQALAGSDEDDEADSWSDS